jgi:hypothetical protein
VVFKGQRRRVPSGSLVSLVVAQHVEDDIRIVCDTHYGKIDALHADLFAGALKAIVVSPTRCVCFAGSGEAAEAALRPAIDNPSMPREELLQHLLERHVRSERHVDFLVAFSDSPVNLARIASGEVEGALRATWIGDRAAFEAYQAGYQTITSEPQWAQLPEISSAIRTGGWMGDAMRRVLQDPAHPTVKGFLLRVTSQPAERDGFRYLGAASGIGFQPVALSTTPQSIVRPLGVESGGYSENIFVPKRSGVGAVGVYINEARAGVLLYPAHGWAPAFFRCDSALEFWQAVLEAHGIEIGGAYWSG